MEEFESWDCAYRTMGRSRIIIDTNIKSKIDHHNDTLKQIHADLMTLVAAKGATDGALYCDQLMVLNNRFSETLTALNNDLSGFVTVVSLDVHDVLGCNIDEIDTVERSRRLKNFLQSREALPANVTVLIEDQPAKIGKSITNNKSTVVGHQLCYHFLGTNNVELANPDNKGKIYFSAETCYASVLAAMVPKYKDPKDARYPANKKFSRINFERFASTFKFEHKFRHVRKPVWDDLADSFLQIFAHLIVVRKIKFI